jgi:hypothetical protein
MPRRRGNEPRNPVGTPGIGPAESASGDTNRYGWTFLRPPVGHQTVDEDGSHAQGGPQPEKLANHVLERGTGLALSMQRYHWRTHRRHEIRQGRSLPASWTTRPCRSVRMVQILPPLRRRVMAFLHVPASSRS